MAWWSETRPGLVIHDVLAEKGQASVAEMHREYKRLQKQEHERYKGKRHRLMSYESFRTFVTMARLLGLVQRIGEKPISEKHESLIRVEDGRIATAKQVLYALTPKGRRTSLETWRNVRFHYYEKLRKKRETEKEG